MKCEDCEFLLAQGDSGTAVEEHLSMCAGCRSIAEELRANASVLEGLRSEELPRIEVKLPRSGKVSPWAIGVAAAAAFVIGSLFPRPTPAPMPPHPHSAPVAPEVSAVPREPLKIKMLTPDPDVVIYWIVD